MASFQVKLAGDKELIKKIGELEKGLTRWIINKAFKPAAQRMVGPTIGKINHRKHRLGTQRTMKARAMRKSRKMMGVTFVSQFGTTDPKNDPYYGAFVNYGHRVFAHGVDTGVKTKPQRFMQRTFEEEKQAAADQACTNLKKEIEAAWYGQMESQGRAL